MRDMDMIERHLKFFTDGNWDAYAKDYTERAEYLEMGTHQSARGRDDIIKLLKKWKAAFPDLKATIRDRAIAGNKVFVEVEWEGTHKGKFEGPFGTIEATGNRGTVPAVLLFTVDNGKIASTHHYFDLMTVLAQMGVGARAGARPGVASPPTGPAVH